MDETPLNSEQKIRTMVSAHIFRIKELIDKLEMTLDKDEEEWKREIYVNKIETLSKNMKNLHSLLSLVLKAKKT